MPVGTDERSQLASVDPCPTADHFRFIQQQKQPADSAILPVPWTPTLMRSRKDGPVLTYDLIHNGVWKMPEVMVPSAIVVFGPMPGCDGQTVDCVKQFAPKRICGHWASIEVPAKCFMRIRLCSGQYFNLEGIHRELMCCRTSAQEMACTRPARNSVRRRPTSTRHTSESVASSAVSRLSSSATAKAVCSSTGRPRTSSRRSSTRAFMEFSLAPLVPGGAEFMDNEKG